MHIFDKLEHLLGKLEIDMIHLYIMIDQRLVGIINQVELHSMASTTGYTFAPVWDISLPWCRHQIEGTDGFYCLPRRTLALG